MRSIGPQVQFVVTPERTFRILAYVDKILSMASCNKCQRKFFTPDGMFRRDPVGTEEYLREKFVQHQCSKPKAREVSC